LCLDFEKGPIHPSPLGPSILTLLTLAHPPPQPKPFHSPYLTNNPPTHMDLCA
jgi:hypothetical protein